MNSNIVIIHFQPIEKYPPILNLLDFLKGKLKNKIIVLTTQSSSGLVDYEQESITIIRFPFDSNKKILKNFQYLLFYIGSIIKLIVSHPCRILYYETISAFPAIIYYYLSFKKAKLLVHYHEYTTPYEYKTYMKLSRWFHVLEKKIYPKFIWISQTNSYRKRLFLADNPTLDKSIVKIMPNYPPSNWINKTNSKSEIISPIRIVYIGSLSLNTIYFPEFLNWVINQKGRVLFDIYSFQFDLKFENYIKKLKSPYIFLKHKIDYNKIPSILVNYHIGLILYKGHTPNVTYCASNKLFEYHACGLDVWVSDEMEGSRPYITSKVYPKIMFVNFKELHKFNLDKAISREGLHFKCSEYNYENVYSNILTYLHENYKNSPCIS
jgi:hypothetical protein